MSNILVLSFAISPVKGSEYAVGWNYIRHMSKYHKLFVLYAELSENLQINENLWEGPQGKENFWNNVYQMAIHDFYK